MKAKKRWLFAALALILAGVAILGMTVLAVKGDFMKLSSGKYVTNEYTVGEDFDRIAIHTKTADVRILPAKDGRASVICYEEESRKHAVSVKEGCLSIDVVNGKKWYEHIGILFGTPTVTVYLPKEHYAALSVEGSTGAVTASDLTFDTVTLTLSTGSATLTDVRVKDAALKVTTGKVTLTDVTAENAAIRVTTGKTAITRLTCQNLTSSGNTGDIRLEDVIAENKITLTRSTGDVTLLSSDAAELFIETDTGDVEGTLRSEKVFIVSTDTGDVDVPESTSGGKCKITTDTGDIEIRIQK